MSYLAGSVVLYGLAVLARAERWHALLERNDVHSSRADAYALTAVGYMGNNVLPARGGDLIRVYILRSRSAASVRSIIGTLVAERVLDVLVLLLLFVALVFSAVGQTGKATERIFAVGVSAGVLAALVGAFLVARRWHLIARLIEFLRPVAAATKNLATRHGARLFAGTLVIWFLEAATYYMVAEAVSLGITPVEALYIMVLTGLFVIVPAGPGYAGTFDAGVLVGAHAVGATGSAAVAFLLLLRLVLLVPVTIVGVLLLVIRYGGGSLLRARVDPRPT